MTSDSRIEVVFVNDTTGSMLPCQMMVRREVERSFTRLFKEIPNLRVGAGAHGDYCDRGNPYVTTWHNLTDKIHDLCQFVRSVRGTNGGDAAECYELVLREAQSLNWSKDASKVLILIADDLPHPQTDFQNLRYNGGSGIDWRQEARALARMGIVVHTVQCLNRRYATAFYKELAEITGGYHFSLDQFSEVTDLIMAICYKQAGANQLEQLEKEISSEGRMSRSMDRNLSMLSGRCTAKRFCTVDLNAVPEGRFQILSVDQEVISIRDFVTQNGLIFKKGRGFYEFTKPELIQEYKEVVLRDKATGDMFSGDKAREMIGLNPGQRARLKPAHLEKFDVFVQSTSYNRNLIGGTRFLYEVDMSR